VRAGQPGKLGEHIVKEESQPDTFPAPQVSHPVHAVIPVATTDQRQAVPAGVQTALDGAHAMFVKRAGLFRSIRQVIGRFFLRF